MLWNVARNSVFISLIPSSRSGADHDCGCGGQLPVAVCECDQGIPEKESLPFSEHSLNKYRF